MEKILSTKFNLVVLAFLMLFGSAPGVLLGAQPGNQGGGDAEDSKHQPKITFTTRDVFNGNLGGTTGADQKCKDAAIAAGLGGNYQAWVGAMGSIPADTPTFRWNNKNHGPYVNVLGILIAENYAKLLSARQQQFQFPLETDEYGNTVTGTAWTGLTAIGNVVVGNETCAGWTSSLGGVTGFFGNVDQVNGVWTSNDEQSCNVMAHLYCFEQ